MFHSIYKRDENEQVGLTKYASLDKKSVVDLFQEQRSSAVRKFSMIMVEIDLDSDGSDDSSGVRKIKPIGKAKPVLTEKPITRLGWTVDEPERSGKSRDWGETILLEPGKHNGEDFIIDSYDLDSPHAFRIRF